MNRGEVEASKSSNGRTRRPKEMTRAVILERAYEMYLARELTHGDERLSVVLESLGYTTGAGYQIWPNQAAFRLDLQVHIAERIDYASLAPLAEELGALRARDDIDWDQYVLELGDLYHDYFVGREEFYLILRFYAMGDDRPPEITEGMRDAYVQIGWQLEAGLAESCEARGFRLRENRSMTQLVGSISALAEGFALRHRVGPEIPQVEVDGRMHRPFSVALRALVLDYLVRV